jgi:hypothetical protein
MIAAAYVAEPLVTSKHLLFHRNCIIHAIFAIMKIVVFILAVTVLICGIIPCREFAFGINNSQEQMKISQSSNQQNRNDTDNCSPFCSCNCCCGIAFMFTAYQLAQPMQTFIQKHIFHLPSQISDNSLPVWQPPKSC